MKSIAFAGLAALAMASSASAQDLFKHGVTLSIKGYAQGDETNTESVSSSKTVYTSKSKFLVGKFSNKDFLQSLVSAEVIADIKGWSLNLITDSNGEKRGLYIVKKGVAPINVSSYAGFNTEEVAYEQTYKEVDFTNGNETDDSTWTERGLSSVFIDVPGFSAELNGSYRSSHSYKYSWNSAQEIEIEVEKLKSATFSDLVGVLGYFNEFRNKDTKAPYEAVLLEGSVAVGGPKTADFELNLPQ